MLLNECTQFYIYISLLHFLRELLHLHDFYSLCCWIRVIINLLHQLKCILTYPIICLKTLSTKWLKGNELFLKLIDQYSALQYFGSFAFDSSRNVRIRKAGKGLRIDRGIGQSVRQTWSYHRSPLSFLSQPGFISKCFSGNTSRDDCSLRPGFIKNEYPDIPFGKCTDYSKLDKKYSGSYSTDKSETDLIV